MKEAMLISITLFLIPLAATLLIGGIGAALYSFLSIIERKYKDLTIGIFVASGCYLGFSAFLMLVKTVDSF